MQENPQMYKQQKISYLPVHADNLNKVIFH